MLPTGVEICGDRWYSKITSGYVNAKQICIDQGYNGEITKYGGNRGKQCTLLFGDYWDDGDLTNLGMQVSWRCEFQDGMSYVA